MGASQSAPPGGMPPCQKGGQEPMQNTSRSACPILQEDKERPVYNVYNQITDGKKAPSLAESYSAVLDPKNNMPVVPNQMPAVGQRQLLSTEREQSTIPKGGTDGTWAYPSAQMFYNALVRKGKSEGVQDDKDLSGLMASVVFTHNSMNEATWKRVMQWEQLHAETASTAQLNRFVGRPNDLSPLARLRTWLGMPAPFDRHDWYVLRAEDREAFEVHARPALDSFSAALDRAKMAIYVQCARWGVPCPVTGGQGHMLQRDDSLGAGKPVGVS